MTNGPKGVTHWVFGDPLLSAIPTLVREYLFGHEWQSGRSLFGMPARGPSRPLHRLVGTPALCYGPPLSGGRRPLTHSPRREVASGPATQRVFWAFGRSGVVLAVGPAALRPLGRVSFCVASPGGMSQPTFVLGYSLPAWDCQRQHSLTDPHSSSTICTSRTRTVLSDDSEQAKSILLSKCLVVANERITRVVELLRQEVSFQYVNKSSCGSTCFVKERQSDQPTWVPIMLSICKVELEDVSGDEREQHQTRLTNNVQWWRTAMERRAGTRSE